MPFSPPPSSPPCESACSFASQSAQEPLAGTAPSGVQTWVLFEHRTPWTADAPKTNDLPPAAWKHLRAITQDLPRPKILFIRHPRTEGPLSLIVCSLSSSSSPTSTPPSAYRIPLPNAESVLDLPPLPASLPLGSHPTKLPFDAHPIRDPLFVVCAHGKRDPCCAKEGLPLFRALAADAPPHTVWQCTHLGGHRFAPTLLALPSGYCLGRFPLGLTQTLSQQLLSQNLARILPYIRGRTCDPPPVQAAEVALRQHLLSLDLPYPLPISSLSPHDLQQNEQNPQRWSVTFSCDPPSGFPFLASTYTVDVTQTIDPSNQIITSCNDPKTSPLSHYTATVIPNPNT